ncbi:MAG TPA: FecR domain-containing protein [Prolixibacteraceae bacterium]|nr:FecR domain-containing protein [Prolixibacteraceae bacterium]
MNTELLLKYIEGNATDSEKVSITNWLDSDAENMKEYLALRKLHDITIWQTAPSTKSEQEPNGKNHHRSRRITFSEVMKYAAVFLVAIVVSWFVFPELKSARTVAMQSLYVPAGQRAEITLEDGTKVWLNAKTTLTFPNQFSGKTREVSLDGEGYFDVVSNKLKPFIVKTEKYNIKVWGTKFNIMAYSSNENFETALFEGSVEVLKSGSSKGILIRPDQRIFQEKEQLTIAPITDLNHQLWKEGILSFQDESFAELVRKLQLYFDVKIEVRNDKILNYHCTGKFRTKDGVEHIIKVLQLRTKFNYTIDEKTNTIAIE